MLYFLAAFLALALGVIIDDPEHIEQRDWKSLGRTDKNKEITLSFWLKNQNTQVLHDTLMSVSTPGSERYGQFLTQEETQTIVAPKHESIQVVRSWLQKFGMHPRPGARNWEVLKVTTTIGEAERLLSAKYDDFKNIDSDDDYIIYRLQRGTTYNVPSEVAEHLNLVTPTHRLPAKRLIKRSVGAGQVTPTTLRSLYNMGNTEGMASNNTQAICSFQRQYYSKTDLQDFWDTYRVDPCTVIDVPSGTPSGSKLEAELDTQYISSMGEKITMQVWYNEGNFEDALLNWTATAMSDPDCPLIFSVSYGAVESYYGASYINTLNTQLMQLGATGVSIFFASGDSGAGGGCAIPPFQPDYPASSPYVTAVGGVQGGDASKTPIGESCWVDGGGGFSTISSTQSWQTNEVAYYLANTNNLPISSDYNSNGRGFPDISAQSVDFLITVNGRQEGVSGTSCASPTAAGIFALLNDLRLQNNMAQLGFANPLIYTIGAADSTAFNDCTDGYNKGCGLNKGFPAAPMWDPCSGYGSPNYGVLATHVVNSGVPARKL